MQTGGDAVDRAPGGPSTAGRAQDLALMRELRPEIAELAGCATQPLSPGALAFPFLPSSPLPTNRPFPRARRTPLTAHVVRLVCAVGQKAQGATPGWRAFQSPSTLPPHSVAGSDWHTGTACNQGEEGGPPYSPCCTGGPQWLHWDQGRCTGQEAAALASASRSLRAARSGCRFISPSLISLSGLGQALPAFIHADADQGWGTHLSIC